jgi:hypothetical protein
VADRARRHPDVILVQVQERDGFGFTYLSAGDFDLAADHVMLPALKHANANAGDVEARRELAYDFLWRYFNKPQAKGYFRENVRWIVAAAVREKFLDEAAAGTMPRVVTISRKAGDDAGIVIRDAQEYLEHPGYPLALIVGKPQHGGGQAQFFASRAAFEKAGKAPPTQDTWLPQIVFRLYKETPSVVMGIPKPGKGGEMAVECCALAFGRRAKLVERTK